MATTTALLIIDTQNGVIGSAYEKERVLENVKTLLTQARERGIPVVYVQHEDSWMERGSEEWQIDSSIAPREGEPIVYKQSPDSFHDTTLQDVLQEQSIKHLVIVGAQTNYCVDTTTRRALSMGYDVTLVGDAHTTEDSGVLTAEQIIAHHNNTLDHFWAGEHRAQVKVTSEITVNGPESPRHLCGG
jgi:nicotinamidase-related amidase